MQRIALLTIFSSEAIAASGTATSTVIDFDQLAGFSSIPRNGLFSIEAIITGSGTCSIGYLISNAGTNYLAPEGTYSGSNFATILTGLTSTSGPGGDGKIIYQFNPHFGRYYKMLVTETGGASAVAITLYLTIY